jgi:drug/metabolite transporter (DMT)-like permease
MGITISIYAAIGCSFCNGISTVLQKAGADDEAKINSLNPVAFLRILKNIPYNGGILFAIAAWGLSLIALQDLPLFLVQTVTAASIIVTAAGERIVTHKPLGARTYRGILIVVIGLALASLATSPSRAGTITAVAHNIVVYTPLILALIGIVFIYMRGRVSAVILALISGAAYGGTSVVGRIITYPDHLWLILIKPLFWALVMYAILGQYFFTIALQRNTGTRTNALMISTQTFFPAILGLIYFNDKIRSHYDILALLGSLLVVFGCMRIARVDKEVPSNVAVV